MVMQDIKPGNLLLDASAVLRVGDFGLARHYEGSEYGIPISLSPTFDRHAACIVSSPQVNKQSFVGLYSLTSRHCVWNSPETITASLVLAASTTAGMEFTNQICSRWYRGKHSTLSDTQVACESRMVARQACAAAFTYERSSSGCASEWRAANKCPRSGLQLQRYCTVPHTTGPV